MSDLVPLAPGIVLPGWWVRDFCVAGRGTLAPLGASPGARRDRSVPRVGNAGEADIGKFTLTLRRDAAGFG